MSMSKEELKSMSIQELRDTLDYQEKLYPRVKALADKEEVREYAADMYDRLGRIDEVCSQLRQELNLRVSK